MTEIDRLAEYAAGHSFRGAPESTLSSARYCVLDSIGSALGAAESQEIRSIAGELARWIGAGDGGLVSDAWTTGRRTGVFHALMVNGLLSHEIELDDVYAPSKAHVGAVVVPAAWTIADAIGASGADFLDAVIVGYEIMGRVGRSMDVASNRKRGWHTTGIIGTFGAAAAASRLLGLSAEQTADSLGLAGTQSSGLWAFLAEGATCKKLHPARAAINGVSAALLAKAGMTGPRRILDAEDGGLFPAITDSFDMSKLCDGLGTEELVITQMDKKPYPCCRTTHHAIDSALKLRREHGIAIGDIESVLVETYDVGVLQCGFEKYPESTVESKFSIPFTTAAAFSRGRLTVAEISRDVIDDPEVERVARATKVVADPLFTERYPKRWGSRMTVTLKSGKKLICQTDDMSGSVAVPLTPEQEQDKFMGLACVKFDEARSSNIMNDILQVDSLDKLPSLA